MELTRLTNVLSEVAEIESNIQSMVDEIVSSYTSELDGMMNDIRETVLSRNDIPVALVQNYFLSLSALVYVVSAKVENLSLFDSVAKLKSKEAFNNAFLSNDVIGNDGKKPTATKLTSIAENESKYESLINDMYNKSYKIMKAKVESAQTMISALSKVMSFKMSEAQLNATGDKMVLVE